MTSTGSTIGLCVIAKNEEANLPRCLASVDGLVDEVVVTDTGSTDATVAVAEAGGARVHTFEWCDDFAAAYNACFEQARCDWVLMLDADEELAPQSRAELGRLVRSDDAFGYTVLRQDFRGAELREDGYTEMLQTRLWRRDDAVRYVGRIHQQFVTPLSTIAEERGQQVFGSDLRIRHYGYLGEDNRSKLVRAEKLLRLELAERPDRFYYLVELGLTQMGLENPESIDTLRRAAELIATGVEPIRPESGSLALLLEQLLAIRELPADFPIDARRAQALALAHFEDSIPLLWQIAQRDYLAGRFAEAARRLERILRLAESGTYSRLCSFNPRVMQGDAALNLGVCYTRLSRFDDARRVFEQLSQDPRYSEAAQTNLKLVRRVAPRNRG